MKRIVLLASLLVIAAAVAVVIDLKARQPMVIERPSLGGPPPARRMPAQANLVGRTAATFSARDQNGNPAGTEAFPGKVMVVNIWATWCKPCVMEMPRMEREIWQPFQPDVALVAVATGQSADLVREFNKRAQLTFPLVADPLFAITRSYGGQGVIPRSYVVNRSGVIVYQSLGYGEASFGELVAAVERALAEK